MTSDRITAESGSYHITGFPPEVRIHNRLPDGNAFYARIGLVASECAHVEHLLDLTIWKLAGIDPQHGACITAQIMGMGGRCKAIEALASLREFPANLLKSVRRLMAASYEIGDLRARIVHDPWFIETGNASVGQFKSMSYQDQRFGFVDVSEGEVNKTLRRIRELKTAAGDLYGECQEAHEASRQQRP